MTRIERKKDNKKSFLYRICTLNDFNRAAAIGKVGFRTQIGINSPIVAAQPAEIDLLAQAWL